MTGENRYRAVDVPVRGGDLRVGIWEPNADPGDDADTPTIVAVHGVTASHRCWLTVAGLLPGVRIVAPDLRGRGRSRDLPGPYGMAQHADDIAASMDFLGIAEAVVAGHSMGGFVTVAMFDRHSERVSSTVLVDGGLPLPPGPAGMTDDEVVAARLGPAMTRLSMTFPDRQAYQAFFRAHPAFTADWNDAVADYVDYDLVGEAPNLRAATPLPAMVEDTVDQSGGWLVPALKRLPDGTPLLRAQTGFLGAEPALYPPDWAALWQGRLPNIAVRDVLGVNHYTILFNDTGAAAVAQAVRGAVG